jgi:hypothetical protein
MLGVIDVMEGAVRVRSAIDEAVDQMTADEPRHQ